MSDTSFSYGGTVAIVTGGAGGIGAALATRLLASGAAATVLIDRDAERLESQRRTLHASHPERVLALHADVTVEAEIAAAIRTAAERFGKVDLLFNNAGAGLPGRFDTLDNDDWHRAFALNFFGPLFGIRAVLPIMRAQGHGHIVNIISGIALTPMAEQSMYAATKAALNALSLALRYELWDDAIRVSSATPGTTATGIWAANGIEAPDDAQTPEAAAGAILAGVARNERIVFGDARDAEGASGAFDPARAEGYDDYLLAVARRRRKGEVAF